MIPNVAFIAKERAPTIPKQFSGAPDLAVKMIPQSETPRKINDKTSRYLNNGARMVWNVYPEDNIIELWQNAEDGGMTVHTLTTEDTLDGGDVLPGFTLPVAKFFPQE